MLKTIAFGKTLWQFDWTFCAFEFMADYFYVLLASFLFYLSVCSCLQLWTFKKWLFHASQVVQVVKNSPTSAGEVRDIRSILGSVRSAGVGNSNTLQYSCLENPKDRGAWWATVLGVTRSRTLLKWLSTHMHILTLYFILPNIHITVHRTFSTFSQTLPVVSGSSPNSKSLKFCITFC